MLFVKKVKGASPDSTMGEPRLAREEDIVDVVDVREVPSAQEATGEPPVDFQPTGQGVFIDEKPAPAQEPSKGLKARFGRKASVVLADEEATPPTVPDAAEKPAAKNWSPFRKPAKMDAAAQAPSQPAAPSKAKWSFRKAAVAQVAAAVAKADVTEPAPVRPTEKVKKPIIVQKVSERKKKKFQELPIRVFIGFLPEVTERDARDYALGIAERNCEQISLVYYDAFKMNAGYAYEVQEGGAGRAFLPEIINYFATLGPFEKGSGESSVYIRTGTRMVQVDRTLEGLQAFLLPESATETPSDWLEGTAKMSPAIQTLTGVLVFGAALFTTGFLAMSIAMVSRIQPYDPPPAPKIEKATDGYNLSPMSRWTVLQGVSGNEYVKALRFSKGKWELDRGIAEPAPTTAETGAEPPPPVPAATN